MKNLVVSILFILISVNFISCKKDLGDCFTSTGKIIQEERSVQEFNYVSLNDNINLILTQDTVNKLIVEAGENIIENIITEFDKGHLTISNTMSCNWVRSYSKDINIYLSTISFDSLNYNSAGNVISTNTLNADSINIAVWEGSGTIDIDVETNLSRLEMHYGTADVLVHGISWLTYIYAASYGPFHCENLNSGNIYMKSRGTGDCYVRASKVLDRVCPAG